MLLNANIVISEHASTVGQCKKMIHLFSIASFSILPRTSSGYIIKKKYKKRGIRKKKRTDNMIKHVYYY